MAVSKTTESSTRNPRVGGVEFLPDRHYVKVQRDVAALQYESPIEGFMDKPSITNPGESMYRQESQDSKETGSRQMVIISCSKADFDASQKADVQEAERREKIMSKKIGPHGDIQEEEESFKRGKHAILSD